MASFPTKGIASAITVVMLAVSRSATLDMNSFGAAMLTPSELNLFTQRAENGDRDAAYALYERYEQLGNEVLANKWLVLSLSDAQDFAEGLPEGTPVSGREAFKLDELEVAAKLIEAQSGAVSAAEALYLHYAYGTHDPVKSAMWRSTAASLGSERAQCDLAVSLMDAQPPDLQQARKWATTAATSGSARGMELVREIDDRLQHRGGG
jgi:TPR repeat protein